MTSAQTFQGIGERSSSRVLAPPGGGQSFNIFNGGNDAPTHTITGRPIRQAAPQENSRQAADYNRQPQQHYQQQQQPQQQQYHQQQYQQREPVKQQYSQQNYSHSSVTRGEPAQTAAPANYSGNGGNGLHQGRSSTRLHAPPGGQSSMGSLLSGGGYDAPAVQNRGGRRDPNASSQPAAGGQRGGGNILTWQ